MSKALKGIGIGGGIIDTLMETWHSIEAFNGQLEMKHSEWLQAFLNIDEAVLIVDVTLVFVLLATWIPIFATLLKRIIPSVELPIMSIGLLGSILNSVLISKYAANAFYTHYHDVINGSDFFRITENIDDAAKVGLVMYAVLFVATWIPFYLLIKKWIKGNRSTPA